MTSFKPTGSAFDAPRERAAHCLRQQTQQLAFEFTAERARRPGGTLARNRGLFVVSATQWAWTGTQTRLVATFVRGGLGAR